MNINDRCSCSVFLKAIGCIFSLFISGTANAGEKVPPPDGFDSMLVYFATGIIDPNISEPRPGVTGCGEAIFCDGEFFHHQVMGRTVEEVNELEMEAKAYFLERFGIDVDDPINEGRIKLTRFTVNPDFQYRVQVFSGKQAPPDGWVVRDGGFRLLVTDPNGIWLGGESEGDFVKSGWAMFVGTYNILVTHHEEPEEEIVIEYRSLYPAGVVDNGSFIFICQTYNNEMGTGVAMGTVQFLPLEDGTVRSNGRNIITFQPVSSVVDFPTLPEYGAHPTIEH